MCFGKKWSTFSRTLFARSCANRQKTISGPRLVIVLAEDGAGLELDGMAEDYVSREELTLGANPATSGDVEG